MTSAWRSWSRWAFDPVDAAPMAVLRVLVGLLSLGWALSYLPDADAFLSRDGVDPHVVSVADAWEIDLTHGTLWLLVLCAFSVTLAIGFCTRVSAVSVLVLLVAIQRRDVYTLNSGDVLLRNLAFYLALMPAGETWSLDARFRRRPELPRAPWALRLLQVQVSIVYGAAVMAKLRGDTWNGGTAVGIALQLEDLQRFVVPDAITHSLLASSLMTYGTLVLETVLVFGLWLPRWRVPVAVAGVLMHLGIDATLAVGWFSYALICAYVVFFPGAQLRGWVAAAGRRVRRGTPPEPAGEPVSLVKPGGLGSEV